ncbi:hypothetical protein K8W59_19340 [Nocardioides rotundus]|uniref:hypothetical protein n=1 Tax=Nocardioides rotundus TaxID=1774216 RepID=UPI001CBB9C7E|nr:hypothetical protein [Nocardioides rotundus]UAL29849.1 hypothetical protein K8W59_19340 [Nocardioides rotundus]
MPDPTRPLAVGAIAMVVCCVGHAVLLVAGIGGLGAVVAAVSGNTAVLVTAIALVGVAGVLAALRLRRRTRCDPPRRLVSASTQARNHREEQ